MLKLFGSGAVPLFGVLVLAQSLASPQKIPPVDEAGRDPALVSVREQLMSAVQRHDVSAIDKVTEPSVQGCGWKGYSGLRKFFELKIPGYDPWTDVHRSLSLGGIFRNAAEFSSNYVVWKFTGDPYPENWLVALGPHVAVHSAPAVDAPSVTYLSYEVVKPLEQSSGGWQKVGVNQKISGYVQFKDVASPTGLTVTLRKRHGSWKVTNISSYCE